MARERGREARKPEPSHANMSLIVITREHLVCGCSRNEKRCLAINLMAVSQSLLKGPPSEPSQRGGGAPGADQRRLFKLMMPSGRARGAVPGVGGGGGNFPKVWAGEFLSPASRRLPV